MDRKLLACLAVATATCSASGSEFAVRFTQPKEWGKELVTNLFERTPPLPCSGEFWLPPFPHPNKPNQPKVRLIQIQMFRDDNPFGAPLSIDIYGNMIGAPAFSGGLWWESTNMFFIRKGADAELTAKFMIANANYDRYLTGNGLVPEDTQGLWKKTSGTPGSVLFDGYPVITGLNQEAQERTLTLRETNFATPFYISTYLPTINTPSYEAPELYLGSTSKPIWVVSTPDDMTSGFVFNPAPDNGTIKALPSEVPGTSAWIGGLTFRSLRTYIRITPGPNGPSESHIFLATATLNLAAVADAATPRQVNLPSVPPNDLWSIIEANGPGVYNLDLVLEAEADEKVDTIVEHNYGSLPPLLGTPPAAIVGKRVLASLVLVVTPPSIHAGDNAALNASIISQ